MTLVVRTSTNKGKGDEFLLFFSLAGMLSRDCLGRSWGMRESRLWDLSLRRQCPLGEVFGVKGRDSKGYDNLAKTHSVTLDNARRLWETLWSLEFKREPHVLREHHMHRVPGMFVWFVFKSRCVICRRYIASETDGHILPLFIQKVCGLRFNRIFSHRDQCIDIGCGFSSSSIDSIIIKNESFVTWMFSSFDKILIQHYTSFYPFVWTCVIAF